MDKVILALERQAKKEEEKIDKKDTKADEEYLEQLLKAIQVLKTFVALHNLFTE